MTASISVVRFALLGVAAVITGLMSCAGCNRDDQIVAYSEPKDTAPTTQMVDVTVPQSAAPAQAPRMQWTMPPGWKQVPSDQEMRYATIQVSADHPDIVMTITPLPGRHPTARAVDASAAEPHGWCSYMVNLTPTVRLQTETEGKETDGDESRSRRAKERERERESLSG